MRQNNESWGWLQVLIEDIYLFLYTIVMTFSKRWKFMTFSRHFHGTFSWRLMKKVVKMIKYKYSFSQYFHDFFTFSACSFSWQIHNSFTTFSHFHHAFFTTLWKMNNFSQLFHQGAEYIFTTVSRHISRQTYFHDKFSNRKLSQHFHRLFTTYFHEPFSRCLMKKAWKWYSTKVYFHDIFSTFCDISENSIQALNGHKLSRQKKAFGIWF